jgi:hypothetical protein
MLPSSAGEEVATGGLDHPPSSFVVSKGSFYYIAAGVGCGIKEVEEVCAHLAFGMASYVRRLPVHSGTTFAGRLSLCRGL